MKLKNLIQRIITEKPAMYTDSLVLNLMGVQIVRTLFFYLRRVVRFPQRVPQNIRPLLETLERDGVVVIPNFFSQDIYDQLKQEYAKLIPEFKNTPSEIELPHVHRLNLEDGRVSRFFKTQFLGHPLLAAMPRAFLNRPYNLPLNAHLTRISCSESELDLPKNGGTNNLHFDAPLRILKAFYYINDADEKNGALEYCIGSQKRNSWKRLSFEHKLSIRYALNKWNPDPAGQYLNNEPWVNITESEMKEHGLKPSVMRVKANSMVFMDPSGFHRRGDFLAAGARESVDVNYRDVESFRNTFFHVEKFIRKFL